MRCYFLTLKPEINMQNTIEAILFILAIFFVFILPLIRIYRKNIKDRQKYRDLAKPF